MVRDQSDHNRSNEPMNPLWTRIHRFIWSTIIRVISDHRSWSRSSQKKAPLGSGFHVVDSGFQVVCLWNLVSWFQSLAVFPIPKPRSPDSTMKKFQDSGIQIPWQGATFHLQFSFSYWLVNCQSCNIGMVCQCYNFDSWQVSNWRKSTRS